MVSWRSSSSQRAARRRRPDAAHTHCLLNLAPPRASLSSSSSPPLSSSSLLLGLRFVPHSSSPTPPAIVPLAKSISPSACSSSPPTPSPVLPRAPRRNFLSAIWSPRGAHPLWLQPLGHLGARRRCARSCSPPKKLSANRPDMRGLANLQGVRGDWGSWDVKF
jgi:hypothetical protein